jgi:hypothetical protein
LTSARDVWIIEPPTTAEGASVWRVIWDGGSASYPHSIPAFARGRRVARARHVALRLLGPAMDVEIETHRRPRLVARRGGSRR